MILTLQSFADKRKEEPAKIRSSADVSSHYNAKQGIENLTTETGAGQGGSALAMSSAYFGLSSRIYMVSARITGNDRPRKLLSEMKMSGKIRRTGRGTYVIPRPIRKVDSRSIEWKKNQM